MLPEHIPVLNKGAKFEKATSLQQHVKKKKKKIVKGPSYFNAVPRAYNFTSQCGPRNTRKRKIESFGINDGNGSDNATN